MFTIKHPPLRERTGDIPILVHHFINKYNKKLKKAIKGIHRKAMGLLADYPFTGNIRELENEIERAIAMAEAGKPIQVSHLSEKITKKLETDHPSVNVQGTLKQMVEALEKSLLLEMLQKH